MKVSGTFSGPARCPGMQRRLAEEAVVGHVLRLSGARLCGEMITDKRCCYFGGPCANVDEGILLHLDVSRLSTCSAEGLFSLAEMAVQTCPEDQCLMAY